MDRVKDILGDRALYIGSGIAVVATSAFIYQKLRKKERERVCGVDYPKDTVIVHQNCTGKTIPSLGHFVMKLETYLRMAKIPFQPCEDHYKSKGPKNKIPWIEYNGQVIGDSQLIINYLNTLLNVDLNHHLTPTQRAMAWAIQKWVEEFTYWLNVYSRWYIYGDDMMRSFIDVPVLMRGLVKSRLKNVSYTVGIGRHTDEEVTEFMKNDLQQLSILLGDQTYLFGDQPAEVDCAVFGILAEVRWATPDQCPGKQLMLNELSNLIAYTDRIRDAYWPDWNDRLKKS